MEIHFEYDLKDTFMDSLKPSLIDPFVGDYLRELVLSKDLRPGDTICLNLTGDALFNSKWVNWLQLCGVKITAFDPDILLLQ